MKIGIGSNLTLEATVNPDFGQVEADPAEVNLSAFETFFDERRPFFVEGSDLLTGNVNNYFYSRRIGAAPPAGADGDFVEYPATTTILGAAKLTGRLESGLSIGMLGAVTDEESARTFNVPQPVRAHAGGAAHDLRRRAAAAGVRVRRIHDGAHGHGGPPRDRRAAIRWRRCSRATRSPSAATRCSG